MTTTVDLILPPFHDLGWEAEVDSVLDEGLPFRCNGYSGNFLVEPVDGFDGRQPPEVRAELERRTPGSFSKLAGI